MAIASSVSPARRADLRRLRAEFEAALAAMDGAVDRLSPAYRAADARYRAWVAAVDEVAISLLDDIDAFEAASRGPDGGARPRSGPCGAADPIDVARLFSGLDDLRRDADLIGAATAPPTASRDAGLGSRARSIVGDDRVARHWSRNSGHGHRARLADHLR